jgi:Fe-S-cluster formation regulator IscX/YfhJ
MNIIEGWYHDERVNEENDNTTVHGTEMPNGSICKIEYSSEIEYQSACRHYTSGGLLARQTADGPRIEELEERQSQHVEPLMVQYVQQMNLMVFTKQEHDDASRRQTTSIVPADMQHWISQARYS